MRDSWSERCISESAAFYRAGSTGRELLHMHGHCAAACWRLSCPQLP